MSDNDLEQENFELRSENLALRAKIYTLEKQIELLYSSWHEEQHPDTHDGDPDIPADDAEDGV